MLLTAEQHGRIAAFYEQAAKDDTQTPDQRSEHARHAGWFRELSRMAARRAAEIAASK